MFNEYITTIQKVEKLNSFDHNILKSLVLSVEQASAMRAIGEYKGRQELYTRQTPEVLESLKEVAAIESTESSNRLEGIEAPHQRVEAIVKKSTQPRDRSEQEIAGYQDALAMIHESAQYMPFSPNVVQQLHSTIYRYHVSDGGKWKSTDNSIVEKDAAGNITRVRFETVSAVETPGAMERLGSLYKTASESHDLEALILVPLTVLDFLCIHPFRDGNGRVGRLITLMLLYQHGFEVGRYISLERIIEESKESYYRTLEKSSIGWHTAEHDPMPWLEYFWGMLIKAYKEFEDRVGNVRTGKGSKTDHVREAVSRRMRPFAISEIAMDCPGVSMDMIRIVLRKMRDEGLLVQEGTGRGAKWIRKMD